MSTPSSHRDQIRNQIGRYAWHGDFGDAPALVSLFAPKGVLAIKGKQALEGRDAIFAAVQAGFGRTEEQRTQRAAAGPFQHHVSSIRIEFSDAARATSHAYFMVMNRHGPDHWGRYSDEWELHGEEWLISRRRVSVDGTVAASIYKVHQES
jgi:ketosteroid isomerase-like protein